MNASPDAEAPIAPADWNARGDAFALPQGTIYLDNAARAPLLHAVRRAGHAALEAAATPWRLSSAQWERRIEALRALAAALLFDGDADGLAMVPSAAHGLAVAARNLPLRRGDAVLVLEGQFPSNLLAWQQRCVETGARIVAVDPGADGDLTEAVLATLDATPSVRIAALPQAYWHDGRELDLDRVAARTQAAGCGLVLDLSQSLGVLPARLPRWRPDFVVAVGSKWLLGPPGLAWLWASPHWRRHAQPIEQHWQARAAGDDWTFASAAPPPFRAGARRFDAGGVADPLRLDMALAALRQLQHWGVPRVAAELARLTGALDRQLHERGLDAWCTPRHAAHVTALRVPVERREAVLRAFAARQVVCSPRRGGLRIAPCVATTAEQLQEAVELAATAR